MFAVTAALYWDRCKVHCLTYLARHRGMLVAVEGYGVGEKVEGKGKGERQGGGG